MTAAAVVAGLRKVLGCATASPLCDECKIEIIAAIDHIEGEAQVAKPDRPSVADCIGVAAAALPFADNFARVQFHNAMLDFADRIVELGAEIHTLHDSAVQP